MVKRLFVVVVLVALLRAAVSSQTVVQPCNINIGTRATYCQASAIPFAVFPGGHPLTPAGTGIANVTDMSDRMADSAARVNTALDASSTAFSTTTQTSMDVAVETYMRIPNVWRHIRDNLFVGYNENLVEAFFHNLCADQGTKFIFPSVMTLLTSNISVISGSGTLAGCIDWLTMINEYDAYSTDSNGSLVLGSAASAGATSLTFGFSNAFKNLVPNIPYLVSDGANSEYVSFAQVENNVTTFNLNAPTVYAHAANVAVYRYGGFPYIMQNWARQNCPYYKAQIPGIKCFGGSIAQPINSNTVATQGGTFGQFVDGIEVHPYENTGMNPEGALGDWYQSGAGVNHPPCAYNSTSYSQIFSQLCEPRQALGSGYENKSIVSTEQAHQVVPDGAATPAAAGYAVPDSVGVDYILADEVGAWTHGLDGIYYFQMADGTSGYTSGFCTYGLIRDAACNASYVATPTPKPELFALMSLIADLTDPTCTYPTCTFATTPLQNTTTWNPSALPLNVVYAQQKSGLIKIFFWLGYDAYDTGNLGIRTPSCMATTSCYATVQTQSETITSPYMTGPVTSYHWDDTSTDPTPAPYATTLIDGTTAVNVRPNPPAAAAPTTAPTATATTMPVTVQTCPTYPPTTTYYGCPTVPVVLSPSSNSVTVTAGRYMSEITFQGPVPQ